MTTTANVPKTIPSIAPIFLPLFWVVGELVRLLKPGQGVPNGVGVIVGEYGVGVIVGEYDGSIDFESIDGCDGCCCGAVEPEFFMEGLKVGGCNAAIVG